MNIILEVYNLVFALMPFRPLESRQASGCITVISHPPKFVFVSVNNDLPDIISRGGEQQMKHSLSRPLAGLATTAFISGRIARHAQDDKERRGGASTFLEEIRVTARKREESMQDAPLSVSALSSEQIDALQVRDLTSLADGLPNVVAGRCRHNTRRRQLLDSRTRHYGLDPVNRSDRGCLRRWRLHGSQQRHRLRRVRPREHRSPARPPGNPVWPQRHRRGDPVEHEETRRRA